MEVKNSYVGKSREETKSWNTRANIITSYKATYTDNVRVINNIVVNDTNQFSIVSPVNDSNRKVAASLVNDLHKIRVDNNKN